MRKKLTLLSSKILFKDKLTKVVKLKFRNQDGSTFTRVQLEKNPFVIIVAINNQQRILLVQEFRSNLQKTVWTVPTGFIDYRESPKQAAKRELLEETGFLAKKLTFLYQLTGGSEYKQKGYAFLATRLEKVNTSIEVKVTLANFRQTTKMAIENKLGDRIGLAIIAAIEKYRKLVIKK